MKTLKSTLSFVIVILLSMSVAQARKEIRLNITNGVYSDEMLVGIYDAALDGFDAYDSQKMAVNLAEYAEIYSFAGTQQVAINGIHTLAIGETKEVTLGYRYGSSATLTIRVKDMLNLDSGTVVVLQDKLLKVEKEISIASEYSYSTTKGETNNRFSLIIKRNEVIAAPVVTNTVTTDTTVVAPVVTNTVKTDTTVVPVVSEPVVAPVISEPVVAPIVSTAPDFNVLVSSSRTLEVQILNLNVKGTRISVNSISGRKILSVSATGDITYISTPLSKGQYIVTVSNKNFAKSQNIIVN